MSTSGSAQTWSGARRREAGTTDRRFWILVIVARAVGAGVLGAFALRPLGSAPVGAQVTIVDYAFFPGDLTGDPGPRCGG